MPPVAVMLAVLAAATPWPAVLAGVVLAVAVCLWLLFRPGSMAHRARADHPDDGVGEPGDDQSPAGGR